jgi:hypothetical protein
MEGKELQFRLIKLERGLEKVRAEYQKKQDEIKRLEIQEAVIIGQITERKMDQEEEASLPVFGTDEELQAALDNRGAGYFGETEEELAEQRENVYLLEGLKKAKYIDEQQNSGDRPE